MKLLTKGATVFDRILDFSAVLGAILIGFLLLSTVFEVIMRYFFSSPLIWSLEISEILLLYTVFLGVAWLERSNRHIRVDIVPARLSPRPKAVLNILSSVIGAFCCAIIAWYSAQATWEAFVTGAFNPTVMEIPTALILVIIPVSSFLFFIQCLRNGYGHLKGWRARASYIEQAA